MSCPPLPQCPMAMSYCEPPLIMTTPFDINGCITGCPTCNEVDIPQPPSCGIPVELCQEDYSSCIQVFPCDNRDEILFALPCKQDECVFTENMEKVHPCENNCVNITHTPSPPAPEQICENLVGALIINDQDTGNLVLMPGNEPCHLDQEGNMQYGMYSPTPYTIVDKIDGVHVDRMPCADEFYVSGDLVCYCDCESHDPPTPVREIRPPPRRAGFPPVRDCNGAECPNKNPAPTIQIEESLPDQEFRDTLKGSMSSPSMSPGVVAGLAAGGVALVGMAAVIVHVGNRNAPDPNSLLTPEGTPEVTFCDNPLRK